MYVIFLTVTSVPMNVKSEMTGEYTVQLSWSAPASNTPSVAGYEVFYAVSGSNSTQNGGTTNTDTTTITMTLPSGIYDFFVVAFSDVDNALPSAHSGRSTIYLSKFDYANNKIIFLQTEVKLIVMVLLNVLA